MFGTHTYYDMNGAGNKRYGWGRDMGGVGVTD